MTVENNGRYRRNSRARRGSVVQRIALSIPHSEDHVPIASHHELALKKSKSLTSLRTLEITSEKKNVSLFPFSSTERSQLFESYVDAFDYSIIPTGEEQLKLQRRKNLKYTKFLESCSFRANNYGELINKSDEIIDILSNLTLKYDSVIKETYEFQARSDKLIEEQQKFFKLNEELKSNLHYYELLDTFTRKLNNPSPNIVKKQSFKKMLKELDECLEFVQNNSNHKDAEVFERRFKQCLVRSLTLIRNYIVNNLKNIRDDITSKVSNTNVSNSITYDALIYTRFASDAAYLVEVSSHLCSRVSINEEFEGLLNDCYHSYFNLRAKLLNPKITEHVKSLSLEKKSLAQYLQNNLSFFTKLYKDEHELFFKIFTIDHKNALTSWLQQLSEPLYDSLRNSIIHEQSISHLCESATLLDKYYEYEDTEVQFENQINETQDASEGHNFDQDVDLSIIFQPILQDVQSRLVFRAQNYADENIVHYKPTKADFQIGHRRKSHTPQSQTHDNDDTAADNIDDDTSLILTNTQNSKSGLNEWYPPLRRGITLLTQIYQLLSSSVFDDLAHNIIHDCIIAVRQAYNVSKATLGSLDSDLFFLKNLLMLRDQIQNFDIELVSNETFLDFSGLNEIISKVRDGGARVFNEVGLLELVRESVPKVVNNMIDAKTELRTELRNVVHQFTEDSVNQIIEPIKKPNIETLAENVTQLQENIEASFPRIKNEIALFIEDKSVTTALIDGIQELVVQKYEDYHDAIFPRVKNSEDLIEVDTLIAFIGEIVSRIFGDSGIDRLEGLHLDEDQDDDDLNVSS